MAIKLGSKVKDIYTGFTGTATARFSFLYGCTRIRVEPSELKDGKPIESCDFDEQRLEVLEEAGPVVSSASSATTGGPQKAPTEHKSPT